MQRVIGGSGIRVRAVGLGAMPLSIEGRPEEARALEIIGAFVAEGGDFIDTANVYCLDDSDIGHNERLIRKALARIGAGDRVVVATKGGLCRPAGRWETDGRPEFLRRSCEASLSDLGVECISLYQLHAVDPKVPLEESLGELVRLREEGKIRHIGLSNVGPAQLEAALAVTPIASVQNRCHPLRKRDFANGMVASCAARGVAYIPHSPVGGHHGHVRLPGLPLLQELARRHGTSPYCIALAWHLAKGPHIIPIPGASKVGSITDSSRALALRLSAAEVAAIDALEDE